MTEKQHLSAPSPRSSTPAKKKKKGRTHLVRAGVVEVLTLKPDPRASNVLRESLGLVELRRTVHVAKLSLPLLPERRVGARVRVRGRELLEAVEEGLGDVRSSEFTKAGREGLVAHVRCDNRSGLLALDDVALASTRPANGGAEVLDGSSSLASGGGLDDGDELGADDDSIGFAADLLEVFLGRDSEAYGEGDGGREEGADAGEEGGEGRGDGGGCAGGAHLGDDVDERVGDRGEELDPAVAG